MNAPPSADPVSHTPGPWEYFPAQNYDGFAIAPLGRLPTLAAVERKGTITCFNFPGETEPNARLIAAAPDLLEALKLVMDTYGFDSSTDSAIWKTAAAAIAKATGEHS